MSVTRTKRVSRKKKFLGTEQAVYIISKEGITVAERKGDGSIVPCGLIDSSEFLSFIRVDHTMSTEFLYKNVIWYRKKENQYDIIYQFEPKIYSLKRRINDQEAVCRVGLPYVVFIFKMKMIEDRVVVHNTYVACTKNPIKSFDDTLYQLPLHNIYRDGRICWGNGNSVDSKGMSPFEYGYRLSLLFFASNFNADLAPAQVSGIDNYKHWEVETTKNPDFALTLSYNTLSRLGDKL